MLAATDGSLVSVLGLARILPVQQVVHRQSHLRVGKSERALPRDVRAHVEDPGRPAFRAARVELIDALPDRRRAVRGADIEGMERMAVERVSHALGADRPAGKGPDARAEPPVLAEAV